MKAVKMYALMTTGILTCACMQFVGFALSAPVNENAPFLVVAPPWSGGAQQVVQDAGGAIVGPTQAPMSALATGASVEAYKSAGAWFLLDPSALSIFCVSG